MKRTLIAQISGLFLVFFSLSACVREDVGPYQDDEQTYALTGFDRLEMGSAFVINVRQGATFSVVAEGDRRNLDDLDVYTRSGTLIAKYRNSRSRQHQTSFTITMPSLRAVAFSGASNSDVSGFTNVSDLDIQLSGASKGTFAVQATRTSVDLSGASLLRLNGRGTTLSTELSGASNLDAFTYPVDEATIDASGASKADVSVASRLVVEANGASAIRYRGTPAVQQRLSGASTVQSN